MLDYPLVSVIIPTHNRKYMVARLIKSILESNYPKDKLEVIVVDDASTDGTYDYIRKLFPQIQVIRNEKEKLLAESRNTGIRASRGKYIFIIDDDNIVDKNTIKNLVEFMEKHQKVGVAGPIMYFLKDPKRIWCAGVKRNCWTTKTEYVGFNTIDNGTLREPYESDDFPNAFMVKREVFEKIGLFNSRVFPIHYDEADFCQRVKKVGYKVMIVPTAKVWHDVPLPYESKTSIFRLKSSLRAYYAVRNRILFHTRWRENSVQLAVSILASVAISSYYLIILLIEKNKGSKKGESLKALIKGLIDGLKMIKEVMKN